MSKMMLVTSALPRAAAGGREMLSEVHRTCLERLLGRDLLVHELSGDRRAGWRSTANPLRGYIDGLTGDVVHDILATLESEKASRVFLNGSNLGILARAIKKQLPQVEILTFFHNVEARFFLGSLRTRRSTRALGVLIANYLAERDAVRHSDRLITLSTRDGNLLARLYGRAATDILPMAMHDKRAWESTPAGTSEGGNYILFVGGAFYANETGSCWFVDNVVPEIGMKTYIVGRGMERLQSRLDRADKVEVVGPVEHLGEWYANAKVVVAPIFDGSGMKTKVAEALMFGKKVVGTSEAFAGYEDVAGAVGWVCNSKEEFVSTLRMLQTMPLSSFDASLRSIFESRYSSRAAALRLSEILSVSVQDERR